MFFDGEVVSSQTFQDILAKGFKRQKDEDNRGVDVFPVQFDIELGQDEKREDEDLQISQQITLQVFRVDLVNNPNVIAFGFMLTSSVGICAYNFHNYSINDLRVHMQKRDTFARVEALQNKLSVRCDTEEFTFFLFAQKRELTGLLSFFDPLTEFQTRIENCTAIRLDDHFKPQPIRIGTLVTTNQFKLHTKFESQTAILGCPVFHRQNEHEKLKGIISRYESSNTKQQVYVTRMDQLFASVKTGYQEQYYNSEIFLSVRDDYPGIFPDAQKPPPKPAQGPQGCSYFDEAAQHGGDEVVFDCGCRLCNICLRNLVGKQKVLYDQNKTEGFFCLIHPHQIWQVEVFAQQFPAVSSILKCTVCGNIHKADCPDLAGPPNRE